MSLEDDLMAEGFIPASEYFGTLPWERPAKDQAAEERENGFPEGAVDAVLKGWRDLSPSGGFTATDTLKAADTAVIYMTRYIARKAVVETIRSLRAAGYDVPMPRVSSGG